LIAVGTRKGTPPPTAVVPYRLHRLVFGGVVGRGSAQTTEDHRRARWDASGGAGPNLEVVGQTEDGWRVVRGTFEFFDTYGLPLDIVLDMLRQRRMMPDWTHLYDRCLEAGWHPERSFRRLQQIVGDVYGPSFREEWERRMRKHMGV